MKILLLAFIACFIMSYSFGQNNFIQIEANKTLGLFSFLETSSGQLGTSSSFQKFINDSLKNDQQFVQLVETYSKLNLNYSLRRQEFPNDRYSSTTAKDLLWIAASNSSNIDDFNERIIGLLPHQTQVQLITMFKKAEPYYTTLIWEKEQENITRIQNQLEPYKDQIKHLYLNISQFYNTSWDTSIPFKIMLYPIPLRNGNTTAIPKGNALICGFLSNNEKDYKDRLGVIIHEMCHILYKEQQPDVQHQIDEWFATSKSPYASLAYSFFDEALATVLGNGWAFKQLHNGIDTNEWYNNKHIDGFAHALFPLTESYLVDGKHIDQEFVNQAIDLFEKKFPKATEETAILMNSLQLFANTDKEEEINAIADGIHTYFNIRSMWLSTPTLSKESKETFDKKNTTKLFIIESDNINTLKGIQETFPHINIQTPLNTIRVIKDDTSKSTIIIMNMNSIDNLNSAYKILSDITYLENEMTYKIQ